MGFTDIFFVHHNLDLHIEEQVLAIKNNPFK